MNAYIGMLAPVMTPTKRPHLFFIDPDLSEALKVVKKREGISEGEAVRRALRAWLTKQGVMKAAPRRVQPRRKA